MDSKQYLENLARVQALQGFTSEELSQFSGFVNFQTYPPDTPIVYEGEPSRDMYFILKGRGRIQRARLDLGTLSEGGHFGELGLIADRPRSASVISETEMQVAKLGHTQYLAMMEQTPQVALKLVQALIKKLGLQLTEMTDSVDMLLCQRSLPRRTSVTVSLPEGTRICQTGTALDPLLPDELDGCPVVAALLNYKAVALSTQIFSDANVEPLTTAHWEGERIYRRSTGLLLLEAASEVAPNLAFSMGLSMGGSQWITVESEQHPNLKELSVNILKKMRELVGKNSEFRQEWWTVEEAISYFQEQGKISAVQLLQTWRLATVPLVSCGQIYAISMGPLVPSTKYLQAFDVQPARNGLLLTTGKSNGHAFSFEPYAQIMYSHERWLKSLAIDSVGAFNKVCISGQVSQLIYVSEGFHEKRIGQIADAISERSDRVRVICISGPSSSGKTTFIKRLTVQLQVNGIEPIGLSLDDYYVDRDQCVKDENGEYDFEALEAIDLALLQEQLSRLLAGEQLKTARYNFKMGKSQPHGGKEFKMTSQNLLMLEGLHGLNPHLLNHSISEEQVFRIFCQPMTSLPFDFLSRVNPSDLRLLRRIVRDRHQRGFNAADSIMRWPSVRRGERDYIYPFVERADAIFDTSLTYEISVLKVYAERYLLEVPRHHPAYTTAYRLRQLIDYFVAIYPDHVPPTSILREFIGNSGFEY